MSRAVFLGAVFWAAGCSTSPTDAVLGGWRNGELRLRITADSTTLWGNCTRGTHVGPLAVDSRARFAFPLDFVFQGGAPGHGGPDTSRIQVRGQAGGDSLVIELDYPNNPGLVRETLFRGIVGEEYPCPVAAVGVPPGGEPSRAQGSGRLPIPGAP